MTSASSESPSNGRVMSRSSPLTRAASAALARPGPIAAATSAGVEPSGISRDEPSGSLILNISDMGTPLAGSALSLNRFPSLPRALGSAHAVPNITPPDLAYFDPGDGRRIAYRYRPPAHWKAHRPVSAGLRVRHGRHEGGRDRCLLRDSGTSGAFGSIIRERVRAAAILPMAPLHAGCRKYWPRSTFLPKVR